MLFAETQVTDLVHLTGYGDPRVVLGSMAGNPAVVYGVATMIVPQLLFTYLPAMNTLFQTAPLTIGQWATLVALGLAVSGIVGVEKWWRHRRRSAR